MKRILVTGGAGFIGSHLCEALLKDQHKVICLDDLSSGMKANIEHLQADHNFTFIHGDILNPLKISGEVDEIYHLACPASPVYYLKNISKTAQINSVGTWHVLEFAKAKSAKVLFTSSSEVYGDPQVHPQNENYYGNINPLNMRSCYSEGKRFSETLFMTFHKQFELKIKIARIFNTYGPRMRWNDGRVVSSFIYNALRGTSLKIHGDGQQTRSFCHISDMIGALKDLMFTEDDFCGPVNLGNPEEIKIKDLAEKILVLTKSESSIEYLDSLLEPKIRCPDISLICEKTNWRPHINLQSGLQMTINEFRKIHLS